MHIRTRIAGIFLLAALWGPAFASDQVPAPPQNHPIALVGGTVHTVSGETIENGTVLFEKGKITAMGSEVALPAGAQQIDVSGRHIYPALIAANTTLGLTEISAVRATRDYAETGPITPEVRAEVAYNPDSELLPVTRANGIALAQSVPQGGLISGTSALMMLDGWTWESSTLRAPVGVHVRWPRMKVTEAPGMRKSKTEQIKERDARIAQIKQAFAEARAYQKAQESGMPHETNTRLEALLPLIRGEVPVFVHADDIRDIQAAMDWAASEGFRMVLVGGADAWRVAGELKARNIPVIYQGVHSLPSRRWEPYDTPFTGPQKLHAAGVKFCIGGSGSAFEAAHTRNLPYEAATAAAFGLPKTEALRAMTLYPAQILGVADRVGTLEPGKDATLIVTNGDPLEITTRTEMMFIQGRKIDLNNRHTQLYNKYREKYRQMGILQGD